MIRLFYIKKRPGSKAFLRQHIPLVCTKKGYLYAAVAWEHYLHEIAIFSQRKENCEARSLQRPSATLDSTCVKNTQTRTARGSRSCESNLIKNDVDNHTIQ